MIQNANFRFALFLIAIIALEAALTLWPDVIVITGHEGDMLHMLDMGLRMTDGELPHVDFMTPIGILGIAPVALFLGLGFAAAKSAILANSLVCLVLLPPLWWVGVTRLSPSMRICFGLFIVVLTTAAIFGGENPATSLSLYYNRWAWAIAFVVLGAAVLPANRPMAEKWVPPLVIGLGLAALALIKMTFFVALSPAVILLFLTRKQFHRAGVSLVVGAAVAVLATLLLGVDFVLAYKDDLLTIANGQATRSHPGEDITGLLASPARIMASMVLLGSVMLLRTGGRPQQGLTLFILAPAFTYITFQNWGNDPKWLVFVIVFLLVSLPETGKKAMFGLPARESVIALVMVAVTLFTPSIITLATSTSRIAFADLEDKELIPLSPMLADIMLGSVRLNGTLVTVNLPGLAPFNDADEPPVTINGVELPVCTLKTGYLNFQIQISKQLEQIAEANGKQVLLADTLNLLWMLGDHQRVDNAAPWYYDDMSGFANADYIVVPTCPISQLSRGSMVERMSETGWALEQRYASSLMTLYRINRTPE